MQDPEGVVVVSGGKDKDKALPFVIKAVDGKASVNYLEQWTKDNKDWLASKMLEHGECP